MNVLTAVQSSCFDSRATDGMCAGHRSDLEEKETT